MEHMIGTPGFVFSRGATDTRANDLGFRHEALAGRRFGKLRLEDLTDEAWARLDALMEGIRVDVRERTGLETRRDDALIRRLMEIGTLTTRTSANCVKVEAS